MKHIFLNLKRFDIPKQMGGVNSIADIDNWGAYIVKNTEEKLQTYKKDQVDFTIFFPELHILEANAARKIGSPIQIGCQGVLRTDVYPGGNFGAFTAGRPAAAMKAAGCDAVIIGHCEERNFLNNVLSEAGITDADAINRILNEEIKAAVRRGMKVLYCIGARKMPAGKEYITMVARFIKEKTGGMDIVYGGGLKQDNAEMLASIKEIDGGLIALTRFTEEIGFYPEEYLEIINIYMNAVLGQEVVK